MLLLWLVLLLVCDIATGQVHLRAGVPAQRSRRFLRVFIAVRRAEIVKHLLLSSRHVAVIHHGPPPRSHGGRSGAVVGAGGLDHTHGRAGPLSVGASRRTASSLCLLGNGQLLCRVVIHV